MATVCHSINLQWSQKVPAPRTVFVKFPHGASFGEPGNVDQQTTILRDLFWTLQRLETPGEIVEPGYGWRRSTYEPVDPSSFQL